MSNVALSLWAKAVLTASAVAGVTISSRPTKTRTIWAGSGLMVRGKTLSMNDAGHDVNQPTAFFEPRVFPSLHHCVGLVSIETLTDENLFQIAVQRIKLPFNTGGSTASHRLARRLSDSQLVRRGAQKEWLWGSRVPPRLSTASFPSEVNWAEIGNGLAETPR